ncbi:MAG TPA: hypothetical protein PLN27_15625 [Acidobacteriota bacterium]|nr:hypothetical protein [Acidobacteriota bacterium]
MKRDYLGDSYDMVKRLWRELLQDWAPLYAEPRFIPNALREQYTKLTQLEMLPTSCQGKYSVLNDPDTGVRLPGEKNQAEGRTHIRIRTIMDQLRMGARCVITFDQSNYRRIGSSSVQRQKKMQELVKEGFDCFYYVSHAPFLFAFPDSGSCQQLRAILVNAGIPEERLESLTHS